MREGSTRNVWSNARIHWSGLAQEKQSRHPIKRWLECAAKSSSFHSDFSLLTSKLPPGPSPSAGTHPSAIVASIPATTPSIYPGVHRVLYPFHPPPSIPIPVDPTFLLSLCCGSHEPHFVLLDRLEAALFPAPAPWAKQPKQGLGSARPASPACCVLLLVLAHRFACPFVMFLPSPKIFFSTQTLPGGIAASSVALTKELTSCSPP